MADLASTAVTVQEEWTEGDPNGRRHKAALVRLALSGQGTVANAIPATALGWTTFIDCSNAINSDDDEVIQAVVSYDQTQILLNPVGSTAVAPADSSETVQLVVKGY